MQPSQDITLLKSSLPPESGSQKRGKPLRSIQNAVLTKPTSLKPFGFWKACHSSNSIGTLKYLILRQILSCCCTVTLLLVQYRNMTYLIKQTRADVLKQRATKFSSASESLILDKTITDDALEIGRIFSEFTSCA